MKIRIYHVFVCFLMIIFNSTAFAMPDYYLGDANIYAGSAAGAPPNIMLLFDVSQSMSIAGAAVEYDPDADYITQYEDLSGEQSDYISGHVYTMNSETAGKFNATKFTINSEDAVPTGGSGPFYVDCLEARTALQENGVWSKAGWVLQKNNTTNLVECVQSSNPNQSETYYTGDNACLQYELTPLTQAAWEADKAYLQGDIVSVSIGDQDYKFVCLVGGTSGSSEPDWDLENETIDNTVTWKIARSALSVAIDVVKLVATNLGRSVRLGAAAMGDDANKGATIYQPLIQPDTAEKIETFSTSVDTLNLEAGVEGNHQPVNEALWDMGTYYSGDFDFITTKNASSYDNPSQYWCQTNHVILVTSDLSESSNPKLNSSVGDLDEDGTGYSTSKDLAKHLYSGLDPDYLNTDDHPFHVNTHVIQLFGQLNDLEQTAVLGHGEYYALSSAEQLESALLSIISGLLEADSSFVAPVVPASPESRAYSGQRIYLGFFKPKNDEPWYGNLKKFGLDSNNEIVGFASNNTLVYATDEDGYFLADEDSIPLIKSFWSTEMDGGVVEKGGVGALLEAGSRNIYTYTQATDDLTNNVNAFLYANKDNLTTRLNLPITSDDEATEEEKNQAVEDLIKYIHGFDAYGTFGSNTAAQRPWIMGDVMHSKPVFVNFRKYDFTADNESAEGGARLNYGYIFVGSNDGMLHAFRDYNGSEAWAFIPPDLLEDLQYLPDLNHHYYFVDNSPFLYVHDKDGDGNIGYANVGDSSEFEGAQDDDETDDDDKAILVFGLRRGGGSSTIESGSQGSYYALDITTPESPILLWQINSETAGFGELAQTWSLARVTSMYVNGIEKIVAIFGGGYNTNEDLRYGKTLTFPDGTTETTITSAGSIGEGSVTSSGSSSQYTVSGHGLGRGIYIVEVAKVNADKTLNTDSSGTLLWKYTYGSTATSSASAVTDTNMTFSIPSEPLLLDTDNDNYTDHIYIMDTGGQLWRFNIGDNEDSSNWTGQRIFIANDATENGADIGRKVFYKGTAIFRGEDTLLFFGTGDREHALNTSVVDRLYAFRDREFVYDTETEGYVINTDYPVNESKLVDVTDYSYSESDLEKLSASNEYTSGGSTYYGWFITLNETGHNGEKVLASPKVFNNIVLFTTHQPATTASPDPCVGQLGTGRLYALSVDTGKAALNFDMLNDTTEIIDEETVTTIVLRRIDRSFKFEKGGLPPEALVMIDDHGGVTFKIETTTVDPGVSIKPIEDIYWMTW